MTKISRQLEGVLEHLSSRFGSASDILEALRSQGISEGNYFWHTGNEQVAEGWYFEPCHSESPMTDIGLARQFFRISQNSLGYCVRVGNNHYVDIYFSLTGVVTDLFPDPAPSSRCWRDMENYTDRQEWCGNCEVMFIEETVDEYEAKRNAQTKSNDLYSLSTIFKIQVIQIEKPNLYEAMGYQDDLRLCKMLISGTFSVDEVLKCQAEGRRLADAVIAKYNDDVARVS